MRLQGLVTIVTGASQGLGRAIALRFAREGAHVVICGRDARTIEEAARDIRRSGSVEALRADVSVDRDVDRLAATALAKGRLDVLVNNASVLAPRAPLHQVRIPDWDLNMAVNVRGPFLCTRAVLPHMLKQRAGSIINVSSGAGKREAADWGAYAVSKFAVEGLTKVTAGETRGTGVRANAVNPGGLRTRMRAAAYPDEDPMTLPTPDEITGIFLFLASGASHDVTGQSLDAPDWLKEHSEWR